MNIRHLLTSGFLGLFALSMSASDPSGDPYITFTMHKTADDLYLKSSVYEDPVYIQIGNNKIDTLRITSGINELQKFPIRGASESGTVVKVWASNKMWFINMDQFRADNIKFGKDAQRGLKEFRCQANWITDFSFLPQLKALTYLVAGGNTKIKDAVIESTTLQRLDLGATIYPSPSIETITLSTPELTEFSITGSKIAEVSGLDKCVKLMKVNIGRNPQLTRVSLPASDKMDQISIMNNTALESIDVCNYPALRLCYLGGNGLRKARIENIPSVYHLNLASNKFEDFELDLAEGGIGGITLTLSDNPITRLRLNTPKVTEFNYNNCLSMDTLDLTGMPELRMCNVQNGTLKFVRFNQAALDTCLVDLHLNYNRMAIDAFMGITPKMNPALNYYAPQENPVIPETAAAGVEIDLSHWARGKNYDGTEVLSEFNWVTIFDEKLVEGVDYQVKSPGVFVFPKAIEDKFQCFITNALYPRFELWKDTEGRTYDWRIYTNFMTVSENGGITGIGDADDPAPVYYNLQGLEVSAPQSGQIYIVRKGNKSYKQIYKAAS